MQALNSSIREEWADLADASQSLNMANLPFSAVLSHPSSSLLTRIDPTQSSFALGWAQITIYTCLHAVLQIMEDSITASQTYSVEISVSL